MLRSESLKRLSLLPFSICLAHCGSTIMDGKGAGLMPAASAKLSFNLVGDGFDGRSLAASAVAIGIDSMAAQGTALCSGVMVGEASLLTSAACVRELPVDDLRVFAGPSVKAADAVKVSSVTFDPGGGSAPRLAILRLGAALPAGSSAAKLAAARTPLGSSTLVSGFAGSWQSAGGGSSAATRLLGSWGFFEAKLAQERSNADSFPLERAGVEARSACDTALGSGVFVRGEGASLLLSGIVLPTPGNVCSGSMVVGDVRPLVEWIRSLAR